MNMQGTTEQLLGRSLEVSQNIVCAIIKAKGTSFDTNKVYELLSEVHSKVYRFMTLTCGESATAVSADQSVNDDYLICLEDGVRVKMLKKYLKRKYNLSPEDYIRKHKLPHDYPMVAPAYSKQRRELAVKAKLGHMRVAKGARKVG
jgi:predicted transcriptional regulator